MTGAGDVMYYWVMATTILNGEIMSSGKVFLNRSFFKKDNLKAVENNMNRLSQEERIGYPTILKYLKDDNVDSFKGEVLYSIIIKGMGLTQEEAEDLRLGDVFEFVSSEDVAE